MATQCHNAGWGCGEDVAGVLSSMYVAVVYRMRDCVREYQGARLYLHLGEKVSVSVGSFGSHQRLEQCGPALVPRFLVPGLERSQDHSGHLLVHVDMAVAHNDCVRKLRPARRRKAHAARVQQRLTSRVLASHLLTSTDLPVAQHTIKLLLPQHLCIAASHAERSFSVP